MSQGELFLAFMGALIVGGAWFGMAYTLRQAAR